MEKRPVAIAKPLPTAGPQQQQQEQLQAQAVSAMGMPPSVRPAGWDECVNYARKMKSQMVTGQELVRAWHATCKSGAQDASATERYRTMCDALVGAVEPYSRNPRYDVYELCSHVLTVFHDVVVP